MEPRKNNDEVFWGLPLVACIERAGMRDVTTFGVSLRPWASQRWVSSFHLFLREHSVQRRPTGNEKEKGAVPVFFCVLPSDDSAPAATH